ncbi:hypothetical protein ACFOPQ_04055 [Deinococcus antarcticus]|uniref:Uncharacterized protein n=1 Tax=Deinococcus antarcticus TaxID=1298767 RepID=A0ABV8A3D5_9DEIO
MKQREVIFRSEYKGHQIQVVRLSEVLNAVGRKMKVERRLQAFIDGMPLKYEEMDRPGLQEDLIELAQAIAEQLPDRIDGQPQASETPD